MKITKILTGYNNNLIDDLHAHLLGQEFHDLCDDHGLKLAARQKQREEHGDVLWCEILEGVDDMFAQLFLLLDSQVISEYYSS